MESIKSPMAETVKIYAENSQIGQDVTIEDNVQIGFPNRPIKNLIIGDHISNCNAINFYD